MTIADTQYPEFYRYNPWDDGDFILSLQEDNMLPASCFFPEDGIPQQDPDKFFDYRFDLMLEAEFALRSFLGLLVEFHQTRKLTHFLLACCDQLEITYDNSTGILREFRFEINFSDGVSIRYSSGICGCIIILDGKQDSFHSSAPQAIDALRRILAEIWESIRELPVWEVKRLDSGSVTIGRRTTR